MNLSTETHLSDLKNKLLHERVALPVELTRAWANQFPDEAGVYALFEGDTLVYVGETRSIKYRMLDFLDTRNHTIRRKLGSFNFSEVDGFEKASSKKKYPPHIEIMISDWQKNNIMIRFLAVDLGRKELEELIMKEDKPKYNSTGRRGNKVEL